TTKEMPQPELMDTLSRVLGLSVAEMLTSAGYNVLPDEEPGDLITIRRDDPRADLLSLLEGETDEGVRRAADLINAIRMYSGVGKNAKGAVPSSDRNDGTTESPNRKTG